MVDLQSEIVYHLQLIASTAIGPENLNWTSTDYTRTSFKATTGMVDQQSEMVYHPQIAIKVSKSRYRPICGLL